VKNPGSRANDCWTLPVCTIVVLEPSAGKFLFHLRFKEQNTLSTQLHSVHSYYSYTEYTVTIVTLSTQLL